LIQNDVVFLQTAIEGMYLVQQQQPLSSSSKTMLELEKKIKYIFFIQKKIDLLWKIFQSLPARKENDPLEMSNLQVGIDKMEDLMIAIDILLKYDICLFPFELKQKLLIQEMENSFFAF
jgi:hypothetical protein